MTQFVYWTSTGITKRIAMMFNGIPIQEYQEGTFILAVPSYGSPRTGNHVPKGVKKFLAEHGGMMTGVVGIGNTTFGPDFCIGAKKVAERWGVPLITTIDLVPTADEIEVIHQFLEGK